MFKNATYLSFYFADNQLFSNSETLVKNNAYSVPKLCLIIYSTENYVNLEHYTKPINNNYYN